MKSPPHEDTATIAVVNDTLLSFKRVDVGELVRVLEMKVAQGPHVTMHLCTDGNAAPPQTTMCTNTHWPPVVSLIGLVTLELC